MPRHHLDFLFMAKVEVLIVQVSCYVGLMDRSDEITVDSLASRARRELATFNPTLAKWQPASEFLAKLDGLGQMLDIGLCIPSLSSLPTGVSFITDSGVLIQDEFTGEATLVETSKLRSVEGKVFKVGIFKRRLFAFQVAMWDEELFAICAASEELAETLISKLVALEGFGVEPEGYAGGVMGTSSPEVPPQEQTPLYLRFAALGQADQYHPRFEEFISVGADMVAYLRTASTGSMALFSDRLFSFYLESEIPKKALQIGLDQLTSVEIGDYESQPIVSIRFKENKKAKYEPLMLNQDKAEQAESFLDIVRRMIAERLAARVEALSPFELMAFERCHSTELAQQLAAVLAFHDIDTADIRELAVDGSRAIILTSDNMLHFPSRIFSSKPPKVQRISYRDLLDVQAYKDDGWKVSLTLPPADNSTPILAMDLGNVTVAQAKGPENQVFKISSVSEERAKAFRQVAVALHNPQSAPSSGGEDILSQVRTLKDLLDAGVLTEQEFETSKKKLLDQLG